MAASKRRVVLLIDADNANAGDLDAILNVLSTLGETSTRRAYGNWDNEHLGGWKKVLLDRAIRPIQQYDYSKGKNAADMALVVDAIELLYTDRPDAFGIVSSDSDFTPLVMRLREKGVDVYGFGESKTPKPFVSACSRFVHVEALRKRAEAVTGDVAPKVSQVSRTELRADTGLVKLLRAAAVEVADEDGWASVAAIGQQISNQSSFDAGNYGYATLSKLIAATDLFDLRDEGSPRVSVRDKRHQA